MGRWLRLIRPQARIGSASGRNGSGPRRAITSSRRAVVTRSQTIAPRRSAYAAGGPSAVASRRRTWPTGRGISSTSGCTSSWPMRPRWMWTTRSPASSQNRCLPAASASSSTEPSTRAADSANRPCGLDTRTRRPPKADPTSCARRWRVCPSGMRRAGGGRQRRQLAGAFVVDQHADPAGVPLLLAEGRGQEHLHEARHLLDGVHPPADRDHLRVVVLAREDGRLLGPDERAADAGHLVGGHLLAVAGAADDHPQAAGLGGHGPGRPEAEDGIVVERVVDEGTVVHGLVAVLGQPGRQVGLEVETGVVAAQVHAHPRSVGSAAPTGGGEYPTQLTLPNSAFIALALTT